MSSYHQLTIGERELTFLYHELSFSIRRIAQLIKRAPSTISRELHHNMGTIGYRPSIAQKLYQQNKIRCGRHYRLANAKVKTLVGHLFLDLQWSPEEISKRLIYENSAIHISYNTIYRAIYRGVLTILGSLTVVVVLSENYATAVNHVTLKRMVNVVATFQSRIRFMNDHWKLNSDLKLATGKLIRS